VPMKHSLADFKLSSLRVANVGRLLGAVSLSQSGLGAGGRLGYARHSLPLAPAARCWRRGYTECYRGAGAGAAPDVGTPAQGDPPEVGRLAPDAAPLHPPPRTNRTRLVPSCTGEGTSSEQRCSADSLARWGAW